jgi:hypothetical protein
VTAPPRTDGACDYCHRPAGSPVARITPGDPASKLVGIRHDPCWGEFLTELLSASAAPHAGVAR